MADFDPNNFVGQRPDGRYDVYVDGKYYGDFADQGMAEQQYNFSRYGNATGASRTIRAPGPWAGGNWPTQAGGYGQLPAYNDALNQEYLRQRLSQIDLPAFVLQRLLGESGMTGYYTPGGKPMSEDEQLDYIWSHWPGLEGVAQSNGHDVSTPGKRREFLRNSWLPDNAKGKTIADVAQGFGAPVGGMTAAAAGTAGALPTFARQQWDEANKQWYTGREDANKQWYTGFLGSKSGPRDWALYQAMRPTAAFGQVSGTPSWEQAAVDFAKSGNTTPTAQQQGSWFNPSGANTAFGDVRQPGSVRVQDWYKEGPAGQQMQEGQWAAQGLDPEDMKRMMRAAWPTGTAPNQTVWR